MSPNHLAEWALAGFVSFLLLAIPVSAVVMGLWLAVAAVGDWLIRYRSARCTHDQTHEYEQRR